MKRGLKGILSLLLAFMLCAGLFSVFDVNTVNAAGYVVHSGTKDGVSYRIEKNGSDTKLILGNGGEQSFTDKASREKSDWNYGGYTLLITSVKFDGIVHGNGSMAYMFSDMIGLKSIDLRGFETSNVTSMKSMFYQCSGLTSLDVSNFNTSKVTDMQSMFRNCLKLSSLDVSNFNTSKVVNMDFMFCNCSKLSSLDVSNFNTSKVTTMDSMFDNCSKLSSLDVSNFNTSKVTNMSYMFCNCFSLTSLDVSNFNTSKVTTMNSMFSDCSSLTSLDVSNFNMSRVRDMSWMFNRMPYLKSIVLGPENKFVGSGGTSSLLPTPPLEKDGVYYTRKWIRDDGTYGPYTPAELNANYTSDMAGTWVWEERPFSTVVYIADGASGSMPNEPLFPEEDFKIPTCQYAIFDHTFLYWDDGQGHHYENKATIPAGTYEAGTAITLTAVFEKNSHNVNMQDGAFEFSIKAGEKATFDNIPAGTSYQVYEKTEDGWVLVQQENASGVIEALEESAASFWNKFQPGVVTVQFTGTKKLDGHPAKEGTYSFELLDENRNVLQTKSVLDGGFIQFDPIEYTKDDMGEHTYIIREIDPQDDSIDYDVHEESITVLVKEEGATKYSHTDNVNNAGEKQGDYSSSTYYTDVITIPGADKLHVTVKYTNPRGQFYIWQGAHEEVRTQTYGADFNPNTALKQYNYQSGKDQEYLTDEFDVEGDSISVLYNSYAYDPSNGYYPNGPYSDMVNYGYYITVTGGKLATEVTTDEDGIAFENHTRPGVLKITKDGSELTEANKNDTFTFEIEFANENGMPISDNIYWYVEDQN